MILTDEGTLPFNRGPIITTIYGDRFTTYDSKFDSLELGQPVFFDGHLLIIIDIDKRKRALTASESMESIVGHLQN